MYKCYLNREMSTVYIGDDCYNLIRSMSYEIERSEWLSFVFKTEEYRHKMMRGFTARFVLDRLRTRASFAEDVETRRAFMYHVLRYSINNVHKIAKTMYDFHCFKISFMNKCDELKLEGYDEDVMEYYKYIFPRNFYY